MPYRLINGVVFAAFWAVIFGLILYSFYRWHHLNVGGVEETVVNGQLKKIVIRVDNENYYRVGGKINGVAVNFVVDTGANKVAVPQWLAQQAGLGRVINQYFQLQIELICSKFSLNSLNRAGYSPHSD